MAEPHELNLSADIQSDLVRYYDKIAAGDDDPGEPRLILARAVEAVASARAGSLIVIEAALDEIANGHTDVAVAILSGAAERFRDKAPGSVN